MITLTKEELATLKLGCVNIVKSPQTTIDGMKAYIDLIKKLEQMESDDLIDIL